MCVCDIFHKIHLHEIQPLIRSFMLKKDTDNNHYTKNFDQNLKIPKNIQCKDVVDFKEYINKERKPPRHKNFSWGSRIKTYNKLGLSCAKLSTA